MVSRSRVFAIAGFISSGLALGFLVASFASPYWVESTKGVSPSGFLRMGLWEACFNNYYPQNRPVSQKRYQGCFAAISYEMRDIYSYFYPEWMRAVQVMVTLAMLQSLACVLLNIFYFIHCCRGPREKYLVITSAIMAFIAAVLVFISGTMFGVHVDTDRYWLPYPDSVFLAWAFGLCILAGICCLVSAMCMTTDFIRLRKEEEPYERHTEARYTTTPPSYNVAVISDDRKKAAMPPSFHQNNGYSPPQSDGRKVHNSRTAAPLIHQSNRYSEPESEHDDACDGHLTRGNDEGKSYDRQSRSERRSQRERHDPDSDPQPQYKDEIKPHENHPNTQHQSRRSTRRPESEPHSQPSQYTKSHDRSRESSLQRSLRRSETRSHSQNEDETRSVDRQSNASSRHACQNPHKTKSRSHDNEETRSRSRRVDSAVPQSHNSGRSRSQSQQEQSNLYGRRSTTGRPARQSSHHAVS